MYIKEGERYFDILCFISAITPHIVLSQYSTRRDGLLLLRHIINSYFKEDKIFKKVYFVNGTVGG